VPEDPAASPVVCVFDHHQDAPRKHDARRLHRALELFRGEQPALAGDTELHARERRGRARLEGGRVSSFAADHLVSSSGVEQEGDLIRHRSRWNEQSGFFADELRDALFEPPYRGVFAVDVVADFRPSHRLAHGGRGTSDGVGAEIDDVRRSHAAGLSRGWVATRGQAGDEQLCSR
jgi:hypothetical protein